MHGAPFGKQQNSYFFYSCVTPPGYKPKFTGRGSTIGWGCLLGAACLIGIIRYNKSNILHIHVYRLVMLLQAITTVQPDYTPNLPPTVDQYTCHLLADLNDKHSHQVRTVRDIDRCRSYPTGVDPTL